MKWILILLLVERLGDREIDVREKAANELRRMGAAAVGALEVGLMHADVEVRSRSLELLVARLDSLPAVVIARHEPLREAKLARDVERIMTRLNQGGAWAWAKTRTDMLGLSADMRVLRELGTAVITLLARELDGPRAFVAALALGLFDDPRSAAALNELVADDDALPERLKIG